MAKYFVVPSLLMGNGFTYRTNAGTLRYFNPSQDTATGLPTNIFDTTDITLDVAAGSFVPPLLGLKPMDSAAQTALNTARSGKTGTYITGVGYIPAGTEPIFVP